MSSLDFLIPNKLSLNAERHNIYTISRKKINMLNLEETKILAKNHHPYSRFIDVLTKEGKNIYLDTIDKRLYLKYLRFVRNTKYATK